jgi:glycosyltransferase involved in cell wall biosynthesis
MQKMNVWFLSPYEQPHGQASRTFNFCRELLKRGHQVSVFTNSYTHRTYEEYLDPNEKWRIEEIDGIRVVWLRTVHYTDNGLRRGMNMLSYAWQSIQVSRTIKDRPDVVVGDSVPLGAGWAALQISRMKAASFIYQVRDVWPIALVYNGALSKKSTVYYTFRYIEKTLYRKAHRICATMPYLHQHVFQSGGDPKKVTWIPNGVDLEPYLGLATYDGGLDLPLVVMYVGGFGIAHDAITIVRAANILKQKGNDNFGFVMVGDGVKRPECIREASANGLANIEFRDYLPYSQVPQLLTEADILVACITDSDTYCFGLNLNKLFDYFASGRPIIFSGRAPNDPVADSGAGFSLPPENPAAMAEALEKFLKMTPAERRELGKRARRYAEKEFDVRNIVDRFESLLAQTVKSSAA